MKSMISSAILGLSKTDRKPLRNVFSVVIVGAALVIVAVFSTADAVAAELQAGVAKVDITNRDAGPVNDPLYVKALVLKNDATTAAIVTVDAVSLGEIGYIGNDYLGKVRSRVEQELGIKPSNVMINASHCHGIVCADVDQRTFQAIKEAAQNLVPVNIGAGSGHEDRIMENRRLKMKDGREIDVRHAYSLPPDEEVAEVGPVDPEIGLLRLDRKDGRTLAVVYNFACHPIMGVPSGGNTADIIGFASKVIEGNLSEGTIALFLQGCGGDINPIGYKDVDHPRSAEPLGNMLGLSALQALRKVQSRNDSRLTVHNETLTLPRADFAARISAMEAEQSRLAQSLGGTSLNLKTFIPLVVKYNVSGEFPAYYSHRYLHDKALGRDDMSRLDAENRRNIDQYIHNIHTMEELTRVNTNLKLLRMHQAQNVAAGKRTVDVELLGVAYRRFCIADISRRADRAHRPQHQAKVALRSNVCRRLHQWLHLLCTDDGAASQCGRSAGRLRLHPGSRVATAIRGKGRGNVTRAIKTGFSLFSAANQYSDIHDDARKTSSVSRRGSHSDRSCRHSAAGRGTSRRLCRDRHYAGDQLSRQRLLQRTALDGNQGSVAGQGDRLSPGRQVGGFRRLRLDCHRVRSFGRSSQARGTRRPAFRPITLLSPPRIRTPVPTMAANSSA